MRTLVSNGAACALLGAAVLTASISPAGAAPARHRAVDSRTFPAAAAAPGALVRTNEASPGDVGSSNTVMADPPVPHPNETPCIVPLFRNLAFADFNIKPFAYAPPGACPGPWAKVVLVGEFRVTAGRQFDRTGQIAIGHTNVYFGTTPEPRHNLAPHWRFQRDLTDESALLRTPQSGEAILGNIVDSTYTGIIYGSAFIEFYPARAGISAAETPDVVLPVPNVPGGAQVLSTTDSTLSATYTFPQNIERAFLDVFAQSQIGDEFWYTCVPNDVAQALQSCGGTAFRETQVAIDGVPAGIAPVYPWIFTGGIDPYLWEPIPGVQTLNFKPYRVDLTPFAGRFDDGRPHTVSFRVYGANNYFSATSTLLLYLDRSASRLSGGLTRDTLGRYPSPVVNENLHNVGGYANGTVSVTSHRSYDIEGYLTTPHGRITTRLEGDMRFGNAQRFVISASVFDQNIQQETVFDVLGRRDAYGAVTLQDAYRRYPLTANIALNISPDRITQATTIHQRYVAAGLRAGTSPSSDYADNRVDSTDTLAFDASFNLLGNQNQASSQRYFSFGSNGACYEQSIAARSNVLTSVSNGCRNDANAATLLNAMRARLNTPH